MTNKQKGTRLAAILWAVAAALAWTAAAIRYSSEEGIDWPGAAAGLFCAAMAIATWARSRNDGAPTGTVSQERP